MSQTVDASGNLHDRTGRFAGHVQAEASVTVLNPPEVRVDDDLVAKELTEALPPVFRPSGGAPLDSVKAAWRSRVPGMAEAEFETHWGELVRAKQAETLLSQVSADLRLGGPGTLDDLPDWVVGDDLSHRDFLVTYAEDFVGGPEDCDYADYLSDKWTDRYMRRVVALSGRGASLPQAHTA